MTGYRRNRIAGGTHFFTVVTYHRKPFLTSDVARQCLREAWKRTCQAYPFELEALCLLPDHLHCIWTLPQDDSNYSIRWAMIKGLFTKSYLKLAGGIQKRSDSGDRKGEACVWQRRYWEHTIRDETDFNRHTDYIHYNPVKHGLIKAPMDWNWSTFQKYVNAGFYTQDWGVDEPTSIMEIQNKIEFLE